MRRALGVQQGHGVHGPDVHALVDALLAEQTEAAYTAAADHCALATAKNTETLAVQPGVLDVRGRVLADVLYLEGVLTGARNRGLAPELIERLEDVVDHGHEMAVLLADTVRSTAAAHARSTRLLPVPGWPDEPPF